MRGVDQGSLIIDPLDGGLLLVGKLKSQDPFELVELAKKYGGPGASRRCVIHRFTHTTVYELWITYTVSKLVTTCHSYCSGIQ